MFTNNYIVLQSSTSMTGTPGESSQRHGHYLSPVITRELGVTWRGAWFQFHGYHHYFRPIIHHRPSRRSSTWKQRYVNHHRCRPTTNSPSVLPARPLRYFHQLQPRRNAKGVVEKQVKITQRSSSNSLRLRPSSSLIRVVQCSIEFY